MSELKLDSSRQKEAKKYALIRRRIFLVDLLLAGLYVLAWLIFSWSDSLKAFLLMHTSNDWLLVLAFAAVFGGIYYLINLPLTFYSSYILPHRFGLSQQTPGGWISDQLKGLIMGFVIGGGMLEIFYAVMRASPGTWWLWAGIIMMIFNVVLANLAPILIFPLFYKFIPLGEDNEELVNRLTRLAERAGTDVSGVYKFDMSRRTTAANAALAGLSNTRRIILGDTLLSEFSEDEIETIFAHELGHHVNKDIQLGITIDALLTFGGLYLASLGLRWGVDLLSLNSPSDVAGFPLLILVLSAYGFVTMPLSNAYSRCRERRADEYALRITGRGEVYANALTRLANQNLAETDPEPWVEMLLYSHPALEKRISMARSFHHSSPN
jgi:STE24 endopeptidase